MKKPLITTAVIVLVAAGSAAATAVSTSRAQNPRFCGSVRVGPRATLPVVVLRGRVSCPDATRLIAQDLLHHNQHPNGWFCADDTGPRLAIGKVEHCRFPPSAARATKFVQAYDPNEFNPDQR